MPSKPAWFHRLPEILEVLRSMDATHLDRQAVETLFGVAPRRARQLMAGLPGIRAGNAGPRTMTFDRKVRNLCRIRGGSQCRSRQLKFSRAFTGRCVVLNQLTLRFAINSRTSGTRSTGTSTAV